MSHSKHLRIVADNLMQNGLQTVVLLCGEMLNLESNSFIRSSNRLIASCLSIFVTKIPFSSIDQNVLSAFC